MKSAFDAYSFDWWCPELRLERRITLRPRPSLPFQRIVLPAIASPRIERIDHRIQLRLELWNIPDEDALQRRHRLHMPVWTAFLDLRRPRSIVCDPVHAELRVELRPEARSKESIAEQTPRSIENENHKLRLRDGKAMR